MIININDKHVGINNISALILKLSFIFNLVDKNKKSCQFNIVPKHLDAVSALVLFKIFDYSAKHSCLDSPTANLAQILKLFSVYGIEKMMKKLIKQEEVDNLYKNLKPTVNNDFFIAPHPINRDSFENKKALETRYTEYISNYYQDICPELVQYFNTCLCEIASNFLYHALEDNNSILMAQGNNKKIEIVCVDNSNGIISSLNPSSNNHILVMEEAFKRGVSSKKHDLHCGTGLWYVKEIAKQLNGTLRVYSEDVSYICKGEKVFIRKSPYWKGTIFYLKLYIKKNSKIDEHFTKFNERSNLGLISI